MGETEITAFLTHLAADKHVAASTQNQAFAALLFLYQEVLDRKLDLIDNVQHVKRPPKMPVVVTPEEARAVLNELIGNIGSWQSCSTEVGCVSWSVCACE
jgi:hypothetical protein